MRDYLLPFLRRATRLGYVGFAIVFGAYFVLATLGYLLGDPHAQTTTAGLAALVAPWLLAACAVAALGQLAASMVRVWLEDHGGLPRGR
ncbi:hypothetical protein XthCFBP4691_07615 [Xanthomonas theicola]|uniref:Uncharacterized protein n=1 Tax=Xanthomonas theicola TaxID=56464 RepID=A0A2S6ZGL4_9XANT|nr:hypothetical protein XthCFBP4691_07615 [Xanthomonas theicola]